MAADFEDALSALNLVDRTLPLQSSLPKVIIECATKAEFDRVKLLDCAIAAVTKQ